MNFDCETSRATVKSIDVLPPTIGADFAAAAHHEETDLQRP
jgi:hypothetical protein